MKKLTLISLLLSFMTTTVFSQTDRDALIALYNATNGENWNNNSNWLSDQPLETWYGVTVENGRVVELNLSGQYDGTNIFRFGLTGEIPLGFYDLEQLRVLNLRFNNISGEIPAEIFLLSNLQDLSLGVNELSGNIPNEICQLSNLVHIDLMWNQLEGNIPTEIGNLSILQGIDLSYNNFNGILPISFWQLSNLHSINIGNNDFTGLIPSEIGQFSNLGNFEISNCNFEGILPVELCQLDLNGIDLSGNNFDNQSCPTIQCLIENGVEFQFDQQQTQKNGFSLTNCDPENTNSLVITEARMDDYTYAYIELTNMSETESIDLSEFELGSLTSWTLPWEVMDDYKVMLPQINLAPGESYVVAVVYDLVRKMKNIDPERWMPRQKTELEMWNLADIQIHPLESEWGYYPTLDSVSPEGPLALETWNGRNVWYIRHHFSEDASDVIDAVNCDFSRNGYPPTGPRDVAGIDDATNSHVLIRKFSVKSGNTNWEQQAGTNLENSEWMPVPVNGREYGVRSVKRKVYWTVGNHGNYSITSDNLVSDRIEIDWNTNTLTVPWGIRNGWRIIDEFERINGLAWQYKETEMDNGLAFTSARSGDQLTLYAAGNELQIETFTLTVLEPTEADNIVVPKNQLVIRPSDGEIVYGTYPFEVTSHVSGIDSVYDVPFATRIDSLFKYLEKAPNASWEVVFNDGIQKADLKNGDILKVEAENGAIKEYFIQVDDYLPSHNAKLSNLICTDIPEGELKPAFLSDVYNYSFVIPYDFEGIPAFNGITEDLNAEVQTERPTSLYGSKEGRLLKLIVTAEDDTTLSVYNIELIRGKSPENTQPFHAEPFFSQRTNREYWYGSAMEICNPGNQPVDLSYYMIVKGSNEGTPEAAIMAKTGTLNWSTRYDKYIPGRIWSNEVEWQSIPYLALPDDKVNPIVDAGDVFVIAAMGRDYINDYTMMDIPDVDFFDNPWGDKSITPGNQGSGGNPVRGWYNTFYLFKILNEDVRNGVKPVGDPADFKLIDVFGTGDGVFWVIGGKAINQVMKIERRPQYWKGNPVYGGSFGNMVVQPEPWYPPADDGEWDVYDRPWYGSHGFYWDTDVKMPTSGLGYHLFNRVTDYMSTVSSNYYNVSEGYSMNETISGIYSGTIVSEFLTYIIKENENQVLTVTDEFGNVLDGDFVLQAGCCLVVNSADGENKSRYIIDVSTIALSSDAVLTSPVYEILINDQTGLISGFDYGTTLKTILENIIIPEGATLIIIDENNNLIPLTILNNYDEIVDVTVNHQTYFEVTAEDRETQIVYQLNPTFPEAEIIVVSDFYLINQTDAIIGSVKPGTTVEELLSNIFTIPGASIKIIDKYGYERTSGTIYPDDQLVVTYDENAYYMLKAFSEPLVKIYDIVLCESNPLVQGHDITIELDENGYASITVEDVAEESFYDCGEFFLSLSKSEFNCDDLGENDIRLLMYGEYGLIAGIGITVTVLDNIPPEAQCKDIIVVLDEFGEASITGEDLDNGSTDFCGITLLEVNPSEFDCGNIGENIIDLTVVDVNGNVSTCESTVTVIDTSAPIPNNRELPLIERECSAIVDAPTATDNCAGKIIATTEDAIYYTEQGEYLITWTYDDGNGNTTTQEQMVIVNDITVPSLIINSEPKTLWPPNHKYITVDLLDLPIVVEDNCGFKGEPYISMVTSDEEEDAKGGGDGKTTDDIVIASDCSSVDLRAERMSGGNGRYYIIHISVDDIGGNISTVEYEVIVPHDKKKDPVKDVIAYSVSQCGLGIKSSEIDGNQANINRNPELKVNIYPNPTSGEVYILVENYNSPEIIVEAINMMGQRVFVNRYTTDGLIEFDLNGKGSGLYLMCITVDGHKFVEKLNLIEKGKKY